LRSLSLGMVVPGPIPNNPTLNDSSYLLSTIALVIALLASLFSFVTLLLLFKSELIRLKLIPLVTRQRNYGTYEELTRLQEVNTEE
jgi:hypothetical protein